MRVQWGSFPGASVQQVGRLLVFAAAGPAWLRQVRGLTSNADMAHLKAALALVPGARITMADGTVTPSSLNSLGYVAATRLLRMAAPARSTPPRLHVEVIGRDGADVVEAVAGEAFGLGLPGWWSAPLGAPGWTQVVAYIENRPVATGALFVAGASAYVGGAATIPSSRRRGAQQALLAARLHLARQQGASRVCVKVVPDGASHGNLLRAGFTEAYRLAEWAPV